MTLKQNQPLQNKLTLLSNANTELLKIKNLFNSVPSAVSGLSDPALFNQFSATSSNPSAASASQIAGQVPNAGTTTILGQVLATSTTISSDTTANTAVVGTTRSGAASFRSRRSWGRQRSSQPDDQRHADRRKQLDDGESDPRTAQCDCRRHRNVRRQPVLDQLYRPALHRIGKRQGQSGHGLQGRQRPDHLDGRFQCRRRTRRRKYARFVRRGGRLVYGQRTNGEYTAAETVSQLITAIDNLPGVTATLNGSNQLEIQTTSGTLAIAGDTSNLVRHSV